MLKRLGLVGVTVIISSCLVAGEKKILAPEGSEVGLPFSAGVMSGDLIYVSGQIGNIPGDAGDPIRLPEGIEAQTRQTFENARAVLAEAGGGLGDVLVVNVYLSDIRLFGQMNQVYREIFPDSPPARATVANDIMIPGALLEASMIAVRPGVSREVVLPGGWNSPNSPYSWAVKGGETLFLAGMVSEDPASGDLVAGDITVQTRQALENVKTVLAAAGYGLEDVVASRVFLTDPRDFQSMNAAYGEFFNQEAPAVRATIRSQLALPGLLVEIQCTARKDNARQMFGNKRADRPFSPSIRTGDTLYLAGMVGRGPNGFAPGDVEAQARQTLKNLEDTLKAAGLGFEDVVDATVFLTDVRFYQTMNEVYREVMPTPLPARATVASGLMSPDALIEIMMTARTRD